MDASENIISVPQARKLLGKAAKKMSDDEIRRLLLGFQVIANLAIESLEVPKSNVYDDYKSQS